MKKIQEKVKKFCEENDMEALIEHRILDLMSELGEVSKNEFKNNIKILIK